MKAKLTKEQAEALQKQIGPIALRNETTNEQVFLVKLEDIPDLQKLVDSTIQMKLAEADENIKNGETGDWDVDDIKRRGRQRFKKRNR